MGSRGSSGLQSTTGTADGAATELISRRRGAARGCEEAVVAEQRRCALGSGDRRGGEVGHLVSSRGSRGCSWLRRGAGGSRVVDEGLASFVVSSTGRWVWVVEGDVVVVERMTARGVAADLEEEEAEELGAAKRRSSELEWADLSSGRRRRHWLEAGGGNDEELRADLRVSGTRRGCGSTWLIGAAGLVLVIRRIRVEEAREEEAGGAGCCRRLVGHEEETGGRERGRRCCGLITRRLEEDDGVVEIGRLGGDLDGGGRARRQRLGSGVGGRWLEVAGGSGGGGGGTATWAGFGSRDHENEKKREMELLYSYRDSYRG